MVWTADTKTELSSLLRQADLAFIYMMRTLTWELEAQGIPLPKDKITVVDVGAGSMLYGFALETWAHDQARQVRVIAIDREYVSPEGKEIFVPPRASNGKSCIEQVASSVEEALPQLRKIGVDKVDLLTLFNPHPYEPLPNLRSLDALCRGAPVIGAVHAPYETFVDSLVRWWGKNPAA